MGGSVSSGRNNDELIDNLVEGGLIKTPQVERVFRAVDRGVYYLPEFRENAYRDLAWREGFFHLSAPCIYSRVMEALDLKPGHSFLNIGSGTGYFSTMAGLIIGSNGLNHNIELHKELVDYAKKKLVEFVKSSAQFDDFDFCMPQFVNGNVLNLILDNDMILYDRIYVGVGVSDDQEQFMKSLLKINGVLVMPLNDSLVKIKRIDQDVWETTAIMTCSFASLVKNTDETKMQKFNLPKPKPMSLQEICRYCIRNHLRSVIETEHPDFYKVKRVKSTFNSDFVPKGLDEDDENDSDNRDDDEGDSNEGSNNGNDNENIFDNIHQLFLPHRTTSTRNNHIQNQLRLMIYGRLLDSNPTSYAIELHRNPNRGEGDDSDDQESEDENVEDDSNITREIRRFEAIEDENDTTESKWTPANSLKSIQEPGEEAKNDTQLEISTASNTDLMEANTSEYGRQNLLAVVQDHSKSPLFSRQSNTIPIPLKMTPENEVDMGRSSESGFRSGSSSSSTSPSQAAKAGASSSNSDSESSGSSSINTDGRILLRKRNYSSDIYSESITADVDDTDDFGSYYTAKKVDKVRIEEHDDSTSPKESTSVVESKNCSSVDAAQESDEGCMSEDGDVSLSGVKLSDEFKIVQEKLKSEQSSASSTSKPANLMQSKIDELPISKILKNFLLYHRKA